MHLSKQQSQLMIINTHYYEQNYKKKHNEEEIKLLFLFNSQGFEEFFYGLQKILISLSMQVAFSKYCCFFPLGQFESVQVQTEGLTI